MSYIDSKKNRRFTYSPNHPHANKKGYIKTARFLMEKEVDRFLSYFECVHHINGNQLDDRIENLKIMSKEMHTSLHGAGSKRTKITERKP